MSEDVCVECTLDVRKLQQRLTCNVCKSNFHRTCVADISQADFRKWKKDGDLDRWQCCRCVGEAHVNPSDSVSPQKDTCSPVSVDLEQIGEGKVLVTWYTITGQTSEGMKYVIKQSANKVHWRVVGEVLTSSVKAFFVDKLCIGQCWIGVAAVSKAGEGPLTFDKIVIKDVPKSLVSVHLKQCGDGKVLVTWTSAAEQTSEVTKYVIKTSGTDKTHWQVAGEVLPNTENVLTVENLPSGTNWIGVAAVNQIGESLLTFNKIVVQAVPGIPASMSVVICSPGKVKATWNAPNDSPGCKVDKYIIEKAKDRFGFWEVVGEVKSSQSNNHHVEDNLGPGTYWLSVTAVNVAGKGTSKTKQFILKGPPKKPEGPFKLIDIGHGRVILSWGKSLDDADKSFRYIVTVVDEADTGVEDVIILPEYIPSYTVDNLKQGNEYSFKVSCENKEGVSENLVSEVIVLRAGEVFGCCDDHGIPPIVRTTASKAIYEVLAEPIKASPIKLQFKTSKDYVFGVKKKYLANSSKKDVQEVKVILNFCRNDEKYDKKAAKMYLVSVNDQRLNLEKLTSERTAYEPIDITKFCHPELNRIRLLQPPNGMLHDFCLGVSVVRMAPTEKLCERLLKTQLQHPDHTRRIVQDQISADKEHNITTTSVPASLLCPIGKTRLRYPCRGRSCTHMQCVDALNMVSLNVKKQMWRCQVCSKPVLYHEIRIDRVFMEILKTVPDTVTEVEIREDCTWTYNADKSTEIADVENGEKEKSSSGTIYGCCDVHGRLPSVEKTKTDSRMPNLPTYKVLDELIPCQGFGDNFGVKHYPFKVEQKYLKMSSAENAPDIRVHLWFECYAKEDAEQNNWTQNTTIRSFCPKDIEKQKNAVSLPATVYVNNNRIVSNAIDLTRKTYLFQPIDITRSCISNNKIRIVSLSDSRVDLRDYYFCINVVEVIKGEQLCERLLKTRLQHPDHTRMLVKTQLSVDEDSDLAATSVHASLMCPIGKTRLRYPCHGQSCSHIQCVDAFTMVSLNANKHQWKCQVCSQTSPYEELVIDDLFMEILKTVPETVTEVEFRKDGSWTYKGNKSTESTDVEKGELSVIELDLSRTLEMIDLTETDDENTPCRKKPLSNITEKVPLKTNTALMNQCVSGSAIETLGQNYQQSDTSNCYRHENNRHLPYRPYNRNNNNHSQFNNNRYLNQYNSFNHGYNNCLSHFGQNRHVRWSDRAQLTVRRALTHITDYFHHSGNGYDGHSNNVRSSVFDVPHRIQMS